MRININMSEELINEIDVRAKNMWLSRSAYITMCVAEKIKTDDSIVVMGELMKKLQALNIDLVDTDKQ